MDGLLLPISIILYNLQFTHSILSGCNNVVPGISKASTRAACAVWFICILILFAYLVHSYINFRHVMMERQNAKDAALREAGEVSVEEISPIDDNSAIGPSTLHQSKVETGTLGQSDRCSHRKNSKSLFSESLKSHILLLVLVAGIFVIGTAPMVIALFIDTVNPFIDESFFNNGVSIFLALLHPLSFLTNSILICSAYSGLKVAVKSLVRSIAECHCFKSRR